MRCSADCPGCTNTWTHTPASFGTQSGRPNAVLLQNDATTGREANGHVLCIIGLATRRLRASDLEHALQSARALMPNAPKAMHKRRLKLSGLPAKYLTAPSSRPVLCQAPFDRRKVRAPDILRARTTMYVSGEQNWLIGMLPESNDRVRLSLSSAPRLNCCGEREEVTAVPRAARVPQYECLGTFPRPTR